MKDLISSMGAITGRTQDHPSTDKMAGVQTGDLRSLPGPSSKSPSLGFRV